MVKKTILDFQRMKVTGEKITYVVAYDYHTAARAEEAGIEIILVGDSVEMSIYGKKNTLSATMNKMIPHAEAVREGAPSTFVIGDMPFGSYEKSGKKAVFNARRFYEKASVDAIKLEGGVKMTKRIKAIVNAGMSVMGHIGLTPQTAKEFKAQGRTAEDAMKIIGDALAVEKAGAFALLVEAVPPEVTRIVAKTLKIPVLSIGAGPLCDGQLLLEIDLLGRGQVFKPKFVKVFASQPLAVITLQAFKDYVKEVKAGEFPKEEHCYKMIEGELEKLTNRLSKKSKTPS